MEEKTTYFYQPDPTGIIIDWSWTLIILAVGVIVWLEYTHFQWISGLLIVIAVLLGILQFTQRTVEVTPHELIFNRVLKRHFIEVPLSEIRQPLFTHHTMTITVNGEVMTFTFSLRTIQGLKALLTTGSSQS